MRWEKKDLSDVTWKGVRNVGTAVVLIILILLVVLVCRTLVKNRKKGKSSSCGGNCSSCRGCH